MLGRGGFGDEQFQDFTRVLLGVTDRLGDSGGSLGEKLADLGATGATQQPVGGDNACGPLGEDGLVLATVVSGTADSRTPGRRRSGRASTRVVLRAQAASSAEAADWSATDGTASRATTTSAAKAASSETASSASTLRSTSMPATFRPCMNRL